MIQEGLSYLMQDELHSSSPTVYRPFAEPTRFWWWKAAHRGTRNSSKFVRSWRRYYELYTKQHGVEENLFLAPEKATRWKKPIPSARRCSRPQRSAAITFEIEDAFE